ncbi:hypothetical protein ACOMHN_028688 [Nucella lapillus]
MAAADVAPGKAHSRGDWKIDRDGAEKHSAQQGVGESASVGGETLSHSDASPETPAVSMESASAVPTGIVPVEADRDAKPAAGGEPNPSSSHPQQPDVGEATTRHPVEQPPDHQPSPVSPPSPEPASDKSTPSEEYQQAGISNQQQSRQTTVENKDLDTTTQRNERHPSEHVSKHDEDDKKDGQTPPRSDASPETPAESSDKKLVNRPRWQHNRRRNERGDDESSSESSPKRPLVKDKSSGSEPRNNKDVSSAVEVSRDPQSGPTVNPQSVSRRWDQNRPRWNTPKHTPEDSDSSNRGKPIKQKNPRSTAIPPKNMAKEDRAEGKQKPVRNKKKRKEGKEAHPKEDMKQKRKWKSGRRSKPFRKGCPGCTETEMKQAEARELHKQVLKAQLLDKLRLVPTFQKQPWPPKLPDQVFPDMAQGDQGLHDDRYYAIPTQLLLLGHDLGPRHRLKKPRTGTYQFDVGGKVQGEVRSARLWVYKMGDTNYVHEQTLVITELQRTRKRRLRERSLVARLDTHVQEGWVSFDVTRQVRRWIENRTPASLQLLAIRCKTCHHTNYRAIFGVKSHFRPVLVIRESRERPDPRERRSECDPSNGCCKFDMTVTFAELGIHEILRPLSIKADYCYGTCERPDAFHYNHTMIVQHMRFNSHADNATLREELQPCCVPVVLREATIYHYLNAGLDSQVSLVPNLLVDRCGCA